MIDLGILAETEGEAWARRLLGHLQPWSEPIESSWPGRLQEARMLAQRLPAEPAILDGLAERIQSSAARVWASLVHGGSTARQ
jgi:hypothetical protein